MHFGVIRAHRFGTAIKQTLERTHQGVTVYISSPSRVPAHMETAAIGGLHITIKGTTWSRVSTVCDSVQEGLDTMELAWEPHDALTHRAEGTTESCRIAFVTEALTPEHIDRSPWPPTTPRATSVLQTDRTERTQVAAADPTTFPLETMTDAQRTAFRQLLRIRREEWICVHEPIWFALLLVCERPGTGISTFGVYPPACDDISLSAVEVVEAFDLNYRWWSETRLDIARSSWRLDLLPTQGAGDFPDGYHRRMGCFYGYATADIEDFLAETEQRTSAQELIAKGVFEPEEVAYTTFVPQVHADSTSSYERAIATGKATRATITDCAERWDLPALASYADWLYHDALTDQFLGES